ncbi:uncharacterized protein [Primulina eburnea]|uniref:uncharacterized protein n=1 Tax=Primulina eburnea TaxID=1245227 RepID=UPI003C6BF072
MEEAQKQKREAGRKERGDRVVKPEERGQRRNNQGHFSQHVPLRVGRDREVQECSRDLLPSQQFTMPEKNGFYTLNGMYLQGYHLEAIETALFGFAGHVVYLEGEIVLPLTLGSQDLKKTVMTSFTVADSPSSYNIILGRPTMNELRAVASTYHKKIKFPVGSQIGEVQGDQPSSRKCYVEAVRANQIKTRREGKKARVDEVGGRVVEKGEELTGISPLISEHQLNILPGSHPVKQKTRHFAPEKDKVIDEQEKDLLKAGHIREIQFSTWLSNVVLVPKSTGK